MHARLPQRLPVLIRKNPANVQPLQSLKNRGPKRINPRNKKQNSPKTVITTPDKIVGFEFLPDVRPKHLEHQERIIGEFLKYRT